MVKKKETRGQREKRNLMTWGSNTKEEKTHTIAGIHFYGKKMTLGNRIEE